VKRDYVGVLKTGSRGI